MEIRLSLKGGSANPNQLKQKFRDLNVDFEKFAEAINEATKELKDIEVEVTAIIENDKIDVEVKLPPASEFIKKELGVEKLKLSEEDKNAGKTSVGDVSMEKIVKIAKIKIKDMSTNDLKKAVLQVLGSCVSMPITIEGKHPKEIIEEVKEGKWDNIIS
ncbi:MAG: 50S ribosomal protein L11 [Candidatus Aenigmarchaeota archaeon]|nr:50S ribosomal protein L11 [Candidatus Aenigmarchaeota archaeon]